MKYAVFIKDYDTVRVVDLPEGYRVLEPHETVLKGDLKYNPYILGFDVSENWSNSGNQSDICLPYIRKIS